MMTAHIDVNIMRESAYLKLTDYLIKPVSNKAFKSALNKVILELLQFKILSIKKIQLKDDYYWDIEEKELIQHKKVIIFLYT